MLLLNLDSFQIQKCLENRWSLCKVGSTHQAVTTLNYLFNILQLFKTNLSSVKLYESELNKKLLHESEFLQSCAKVTSPIGQQHHGHKCARAVVCKLGHSFHCIQNLRCRQDSSCHAVNEGKESLFVKSPQPTSHSLKCFLHPR